MNMNVFGCYLFGAHLQLFECLMFSCLKFKNGFRQCVQAEKKQKEKFENTCCVNVSASPFTAWKLDYGVGSDVNNIVVALLFGK